MSEKAIFVRSTAHTPLILTEPNPNPEKPGEAGPLGSVTIASSGRPGVPAVTKLEGADAETFRKWSKANAKGDLLGSGVLTVGSDDEGGEIVWGHEVFLEGAEGSGSTVEAAAGAVKSDDLTPKGPGAPDDGSGEPRHAAQPGEAEPKKGAAVAPAPDAGRAIGKADAKGKPADATKSAPKDAAK